MGITKVEAEAEAAKIIKEVDDDASGEIEFTEFATIWQRKLLSVNESYIHAVFTVLDENGDGNIDCYELAKVLEINDSEKIQAYIKEVDADGDGCINFEEFRRAMMETKDVNLNNVGQHMKKGEIAAAADKIGEVNLD